MITRSQVEKVSSIMQEEPVLLAREVHGKITDAEHAAFKKVWINRLFNPANVTREPHVRVPRIYMAMDPNGGGSGSAETGSEMAITSLYYDGLNVSVRARARVSGGAACGVAAGGRVVDVRCGARGRRVGGRRRR